METFPAETFPTNWILVTGGLGFIGSHTSVLLMEQSWNLVIYDNLSNSNIEMVEKLKQCHMVKNDFGSSTNLTKLNKGSFIFEKGDLRNEDRLDELFRKYHFYAVIHFAALKSVNESNKYKDLYYDVNIKGTSNLLNAMQKYKCDKFIYSSSATVYGDQPSPVNETDPTGINLSCWYAENKYAVEQMLINQYQSKNMTIRILRYFNPIGAHPSGLIGEDPKGTPNNIFPYLLRVVKNQNTPHLPNDPFFQYALYDKFTIFGGDYPTSDGTCIRDYVHVMDLARAHLQVLNNMNIHQDLKIYNVGTGHGTSVYELINTLNNILIANNLKPIPFVIGDRRDGDIIESYANADYIYRDIAFKTTLSIDDMIIDGLNFIGFKCHK